MFSDFLDTADYFLSEGHKDPAAVISGSVLEDHIRKICVKNGVPITFIDHRGDTKPKKADAMNSELARATVYNSNQQKIVTAWLGIRNSAAHGNYSQYTDQDVKMMVLGVRQLIAQYPA